MKTKNGMKQLAVFMICFNCIFLPCLILILSGMVTLEVRGFAVDRNNRLYIGNAREISIFENGTKVQSIDPHTSRSYIFTINAEDRVLLSTSRTVYIMDLDGNILYSEPDRGADTYNQLSYKKRIFTSSAGDTYKLRNILGYLLIVKNGSQVVWSMGALSYIVMVAIGCCGIGMVIFILWFIG